MMSFIISFIVAYDRYKLMHASYIIVLLLQHSFSLKYDSYDLFNRDNGNDGVLGLFVHSV